MNELHLEAYRCPTVFRAVRQGMSIMKSNGEPLLVTTIEPSILRDLNAFIASEGFDVTVKQETRSVTAEMRAAWEEDFDEEAFENIDQQIALLITLN